MFVMIWFGDIKKAKLMAIVVGIIVAGLLLAAATSFTIQSYKISTYKHVEATVIDFDTRDGNNVWTEFEYSVDGQIFTVRLKGHSYWMSIDSQVNMLVNPRNLGEAEVLYDKAYTISVIFLGIAGLFSVFFLLYLINYIVLRKRGV